MSAFEQEKLLLFDQMRLAPPNLFVPWDHPPHRPASEARYADGTECFVVEQGGEARAYPLYLIASHHLVPDALGGRELLVTF